MKYIIKHKITGGVIFKGDSLVGANLRGVNLWGADLRGADLWGADLQDADLRGANLRGVDLRYANLRDADLRDADLRGVNLWGADLRDAGLSILNLSPYVAYVQEDSTQIGCELHTNDEWAAFTDADIGGMDGQGALDYWAKYKDTILSRMVTLKEG